MPMGEYSDGADIQMLPWYCWYVAKGWCLLTYQPLMACSYMNLPNYF